MGIGVRGLPEGTSPSDLEELNTQQIIAFLDKLGEWRCTKALHESTCRLMSERRGGGKAERRRRLRRWQRTSIPIPSPVPRCSAALTSRPGQPWQQFAESGSCCGTLARRRR